MFPCWCVKQPFQRKIVADTALRVCTHAQADAGTQRQKTRSSVRSWVAQMHCISDAANWTHFVTQSLIMCVRLFAFAEKLCSQRGKIKGQLKVN